MVKKINHRPERGVAGFRYSVTAWFFSIVIVLLLGLTAVPSPAQQVSANYQPQTSIDIASDSDVEGRVLARHLVGLESHELSELAEIWQDRVKRNIATIASLAVELDTASGARFEDLLAELRRVNEQNIEYFENYVDVLSAWSRKDSENEDLKRHQDYVSGFISELLISFRIDTTLQLAWDWFWSARGGLRMLGGILQLALTLVLGVYIAKSARAATRKWLTRADDDASIQSILVPQIVFWLLVSLVAVFAVWQQGVDLNFAVAVIGGLGFLFAFVFQNVFQSVIGGLLLRTTEPYAKGDIISINQTIGTVVDVNVVATKLRTFDNSMVQIPNQAIWQGSMENFTKYRVRRVDLVFGIGYRDDIQKAKEVLSQLVREDERCLSSPEPKIFVGELGPSSVNLYCRPWVRTTDYWDVLWDLTEAGKTELQKEGVQIAYPQMDVHLQMDDMPPSVRLRDE